MGLDVVRHDAFIKAPMPFDLLADRLRYIIL